MLHRLNRKDENMLHISADEEIYRIFSLNQFIKAVRMQRLTMVKPWLWEDPFENFLSKSTGYNRKGKIISFKYLANHFFGQCWSLEREKDWMWKMYAPNGRGIKVKTKVNTLFEQFNDTGNPSYKSSYFIGKIQYMEDYEIRSFYIIPGLTQKNLKDPSGKGVAQTVMIKRKEFCHEKEARLVFYPDKKNGQTTKGNRWNTRNKFYHFKFDPVALLDEIVFDPRMPNSLYKIYRKILIGYGFDKNRIIHSPLYKFEPLKIPIK